MTSAESLFHQAGAHLTAREFDAAIGLLRAALAFEPDAAPLHANLGWALEHAGQAPEAETHYRRAIGLGPQLLQVRLNLGALLTAQRRLPEAEQIYRDALALAPESPAALSNYGMLLACLGCEQEAQACYRQALAFDPEYAKASFNLAYLLLRQGRWDEGWTRLEARDWSAALQRHLNLPRWQGGALAGKAILVGIEAGHGDMIQFGRYCAQLKAAGAARVGVQCHPGLVALFAGLRGADAAIALDAPLPAGFDCWVPALSLPFHFHTTVDTVPAALPYIDVDPVRVARLAPLLGGDARELKVGLAWRGNPRFENDGERSLPSLATLAPLAQVPGVRWFSLQKGEGEGEARRGLGGLPVTDLAPVIRDFADTAALIDGLDLVISVDTAVAHLAGALNKPCWVLLPAYLTDWRWLTERADTLWYPAVMRLFRQRPGARWDAVVADLAEALRARVHAR
ncbi:tetratricopeptide repeat protein [Massilia sp. 9096]|uniref:tetratricopeptide repeat-containing glycosyltransferase family protein n=1 Tax=Massilia sp. 9096 TaxID=1500894 RepID=UPI0009E0077C|nr:tetratricopeptide repeat-containing glycosyltransferase family protein [Massilia sp. 9096]